MEDQNLKILIERVILKDEQFPDKEVVWNKILSQIEHFDPLKRPNSRSRKMVIKRYWSVAVSIAAAVCLIVTLGFKDHVISSNQEMPYVLPDGSSVTLAENSSLRYSRIGWWFTHSVTLDGDASFVVAKQRNHFSVAVKEGTITVLGTQFAIEQQAGHLHVACTEGSVAVETAVGVETLHKDQQLDFDGSQMQVSPIYPEYLEFNNAPLSSVIIQIEQIFGLEVVNKADSSYLFSGWISTRNIDEALEVVTGSCGLHYDLAGNQLTIKP